MRTSPARRAAIERMSLTLLVVISAALIIVGKADQLAFQYFRNSIMDAAAPALDMLSRPAAALDAAADRVRGFIAVYRDNTRLAEENERLLGWQQVALRLSAENAELRGLSNEVRQKLVALRPRTIGQAARLDGITPAALTLLVAHLKRKGRSPKSARHVQ